MASTKAREKIILEIKQLYRKREPLNISAVKRYYPELLRSVYAVRPFWGWRRALEDASIDYGKINVELLDYVTCHLCGEDFGRLPLHLRDKHHTSAEDYLEQFPNAELVSEEWRSAKATSLRQKTDIPHWEPLWSPEYVLDRIAELHRKGFPLHVSSVQQHATSLHSIARIFFGSWDDALQRTGLNPKTIRLIDSSMQLSKLQIAEQLRAWHRRGLPLNHNAIEQKSRALYSAIHRVFPDYDSALRSAGFEPAKIRRRPETHPEATAQRLLQRIREASVLPEKQRHRLWKKLLDEYRLLVKSTRFRGWRKVFAEAGVDRSLFPIKACDPKNRVDVRFPTRDSVIKAFRQRLRIGLTIHSQAVLKEDSVLYRGARRYFGCVSNVCTYLKQPATKSRAKRYPDRESVLAALERRQNQRLPIDSQSIDKDDHRLYMAICQHLGGMARVYKLYGQPVFHRV